jgi:F-type H+-transporting ATPase subunit delta
MNGGLISSRYADALLKFVGKDDGTEVCSQAETIEKALDEVPKLRVVLGDPADVSDKEKLNLLKSALDGKEMNPKLEAFLNLVLHNRRVSDLRLILHTFTDRYYFSRKIRFGHLTTAAEAPGLEEKLRSFYKGVTGFDLVIDTKIDPSIIGGFIFSVDCDRIDASVSRQIETLRQQFIEKNKRIV